MEVYISKDFINALIFFHFIVIIVLTVYNFNRGKKIKRWFLKISKDSSFPNPGLLFMIFLGFLSLWGVLSHSIIFTSLSLLMFYGWHIFLFIMFRRKCPFCKNNVKDYALVCTHCKNNISSSIIE